MLICKRPEDAPDKPEYVEIDFEQGIPKKINGVAYGPVEIIEKLNEIGARNGVGIATWSRTAWWA